MLDTSNLSRYGKTCCPVLISSCKKIGGGTSRFSSLGLSYAFPIALTITALLAVLALSYYQIIQGYPSGGGSYAVARSTLGTVPGLIAAAALIVNYLLCVAVSLTIGMDAIASAFNELWPYRVFLSLLLLVVITVLNLKGLHETGTVMTIPVCVPWNAFLRDVPPFD